MVLGGESSFGKNGKPTSPSPPAAPCARHPHPVSPCVPPYGTALYPGLPGPPGMLPYLWIPCACPLCGARRRLGGGGGRGPLAGLGQPLPRGSVLAPSSPRFGMGGGWTHRGSPGMASRGWAERSNTRPRRAGSSTEGLSEHHRHPGGVGPSEIKETRSPRPRQDEGRVRDPGALK